jgi:hypothetical protein
VKQLGRTFLVGAIVLWWLSAPLPAQSSPTRSKVKLGTPVAVSTDLEGLTSAEFAAIGPARDLFVAGPDSPVILHLNSAGARLGLIGRDGEGPGEYRRIGAMGWTGDTLWVRDDMLRRITLLSDRGAFLHTIPFLRLQSRDPRFSTLVARGLTSLGKQVYVEGFSPGTDPKVLEAGARVVVVSDVPGSKADTVLTLVPQRAPIRLSMGNGGNIVVPQPWAGADVLALAGDGSFLARIRRTPQETAGHWSYELTAVRPSGTPMYTVTIPFEPETLDEPLVEKWLTQFTDPRLISAFGSEGKLRKALIESVYRPPVLPPTVQVVIGTDGSVWITRERVVNSFVCDVVDPSGKLLGTIPLPSHRRLLAAGRDYAWLIHESDQSEGTLVLERATVIRNSPQ